MTVNELAKKTYLKVSHAKSEGEVRSIIDNAFSLLNSSQIETFIDAYLNSPRLIADAQENSQTLKNLSKAREILLSKKGK